MARFMLEPGPIPLHHQVYLDLKAALDNGEWTAGDRIPGERELAGRYGCSLITVRRALDELVREHRIERGRGRGTFVLPPLIDRDLQASIGFAEEMRRRGLEPANRVVTARVEAASEQVATALRLALGAPVYYIERLRLASAEPLLLEMVHLPAGRFPGLLDLDLETNSLYELLASRYATRIAHATEWLEPVSLPEPEARLLGLHAGDLALLVHGVASTTGGTPIELGRTYVRSDRTRYYVERVVGRTARLVPEHVREEVRPAGRRLERPA